MIALPDVNGMSMGYRQITDAVLVALAMQHAGRLATFDGGIKSLLPKTRQPSVHVIPV